MRRRAEKAFEQLRARLLDGPGEVDRAIRRAAFTGEALPATLAGLVDKIRRHAYRVTDGDVAEAVAAGWTESQLFEVAVAAAAGAGMARLDVVERLLGESPRGLR